MIFNFLFGTAMKSRISASMDSGDDISYSKAAKLELLKIIPRICL